MKRQRNVTFVRVNPVEHCAIPWCWYLRGRAYINNLLVLTFSGFRVALTTSDPAKLLEEITLGKVCRLMARETPLEAEEEQKANKEGVYSVTFIDFHGDEDDEEDE